MHHVVLVAVVVHEVGTLVGQLGRGAVSRRCHGAAARGAGDHLGAEVVEGHGTAPWHGHERTSRSDV